MAKGGLYKHHLKRELGLAEATFYGLGIIIGAGIYVLLGSAAGTAGNSVWLSFLISAIIAAFTGLSYCELSSRYPHEAAEYLYASKAFGPKLLPFLIGWLLIITSAFSAATVALGFAGYFGNMFGTPLALTAIVLLVVLSIINFRGIKESADISVVLSILQIVGLLIVIFFAIPHLGSVDYFSTPMGTLPLGFGGVAAAAALVFFAYIGFDTIPKISDETRKPSKTIPKALIWSLLISTVLYIVVAVSVVSIIPWSELATSTAPLADTVARAAGPWWGSVVTIMAYCATISTVLIILVAGSRMIYGMAEEGALPKFLSAVHPKRRTPFVAIFLMLLLSMFFVYAGDLVTVANMTTAGMFIVFIVVNASLIVVRRKPGHNPPFKVPLNIGKFPILALFGLITSIYLLLQFEPVIYAYEAATLFVGLMLYGLVKKEENAVDRTIGRMMRKGRKPTFS
jgi:APA family basic amino acid/polyamine antiporter